jgi:hypothetical protein
MQRAGNPGRTRVHGTKTAGRSPLPTRLLCGRIVAHGVKAFEKIVIVPCTLVRTWGTRPRRLGNEIRSVPLQTLLRNEAIESSESCEDKSRTAGLVH